MYVAKKMSNVFLILRYLMFPPESLYPTLTGVSTHVACKVQWNVLVDSR